MTRQRGVMLGLLAGLLGLSACASMVPPNRLAAYMGEQAVSEPLSPTSLPEQRPIHAGLVLIPDTTAPDAAPALPDEALNRLGDELKQQFARFLPIAIDNIIPAEGLRAAAQRAVAAAR